MSAARFVRRLVKLSQQAGEYEVVPLAAAAVPVLGGLGGAALGAGYGALTAPSAKDRLESVLRGVVLGGGTGGSMGLGVVGGTMHGVGGGADMQDARRMGQMGGVAGGYIGNLIGEGLLGRPSWEREEAQKDENRDHRTKQAEDGDMPQSFRSQAGVGPSLRAAVLASPILAGLGVGGALAYGAHSAPRGREWHGAGSTYAQTAGTLGGAGAGSVLGGLVGGGLGAAAGLSRADLARAMLAGGGLGGLGGGYAGNRLSAALHPGPAQLGLGDRDGDERRREKQGGFKLANTPPAPALPEDPQHPSVMSSRPPAPALPEDSPQVSTAGSSGSIGPVPMGAGYSPYASIESPEFKPKLTELPTGERTWQQFGQGIGKQIYNNPVPYALGAGAAGLGLYGLHNMMQQPRRKRRYEEA